jgi:two-component system chemotaxis response regulator CheB
MHILGADPEICVIGGARNGEEALKAVERSQPDVITMDINMPQMDGLEATRQIMETRPTPIVIVSGLLNGGDAGLTFRAMEAGALAVQASPPGVGHPDYAARAEDLIRTVKLMSEVKVVRRWARLRGMNTGSLMTGQLAGQLTGPFTTASLRTSGSLTLSGPLALQTESATNPTAEGLRKPPRGGIKLVAVGASTGGPPVLRTLLSSLPPNFPVPIVIVQHITAGFTVGFAEWLADSSNYPVVIPRNGEQLSAGKAYVALDGMHLGIEAGNRVALSDAPPEHGMRPAVSYLFRSVAMSLGPNVLGVLLTGMGRDGAAELKALYDLGAVTIAQDAESSVVHGMPGEAIKLGGAAYVRPAGKIGELIAGMVSDAQG